MPGPPANPDARRRNKRGAGFTVLPPHRDGEVPALPDMCQGQPWEPLVLEAWEAWWRSPMATQWTDADVAFLTLAAMHLQLAVGGNEWRAAEYRLVADRFGLSPLARLKNRWLIGDEEVAGTDAHDADVVQLRAVGGDG